MTAEIGRESTDGSSTNFQARTTGGLSTGGNCLLHLGAVYLNQSQPVSGGQATGCYLTGTYLAQETSALEDASQWAKTYYTSDYRRYNRDADRVVVLSTGRFLNVFQSRRDASRKVAVVNREQSSVTVRAAAPVHVTATGAEVLLVADRTVTVQPKLKRPATVTTTSLALLLELRPVEGGWLVESVQGRPGRTDVTCSDPSTSTERGQLLADTCRTMTTLLGLDVGGKDAAAAVKPVTTSDFATKAVAALQALLPAGAKVSGAPAITAAGIVTGGEGTAEMLVFGDQLLTGRDAPKPFPFPLRLQVSMQKVGGGWVVTGLRRI